MLSSDRTPLATKRATASLMAAAPKEGKRQESAARKLMATLLRPCRRRGLGARCDVRTRPRDRTPAHSATVQAHAARP
eukprot:7379075-Pyramimonas_sp.AAC.1